MASTPRNIDTLKVKERVATGFIYTGYFCLCATGVIMTTIQYGYITGLAALGAAFLVSGAFLKIDINHSGGA